MGEKELKLPVHDCLVRFDGNGDVLEWLQGVELIAKMTGVKDLACLIPIYLKGGARAVYAQMSDEDKKDAEKIKKRLKEAFCCSAFLAYKKLISSTWKGEPVCTYVNELRHLANLSGFEESAAEKLVKLAFITGFPDSISIALKQFDSSNELGTDVVVARAQIIVENGAVQAGSSGEIGAVASGGPVVLSSEVGAVALSRRHEPPRRQETGLRGGRAGFRPGPRPGVRCFNCNGPHYVRDCPNKTVKCYACGQEGHVASQCSGN